MPDTFQIAASPRGYPSAVAAALHILEMEVRGDAKDSLQAAQHMCDAGAQCLLILGGDGTHRVVAKASGTIPLVPISTGTNNVFPQMLEGTVAGLAAGFYASHAPQLDGVILPTKRLEIWRDGVLQDIALVDVAVSAAICRRTRPLGCDRYPRIVLDSRHAQYWAVIDRRLSHPITMADTAGLHLILGDGGRQVRAPIAPGLIVPVGISYERLIEPGERSPIRHAPTMLGWTANGSC